jgi:hypothetical protein
MDTKQKGRRIVTHTECAQLDGVARPTVDRAVARGEIVEEIGGGIDAEKGAAVWLARRKRRQTSAEIEAKR